MQSSTIGRLGGPAVGALVFAILASSLPALAAQPGVAHFAVTRKVVVIHRGVYVTTVNQAPTTTRFYRVMPLINSSSTYQLVNPQYAPQYTYGTSYAPSLLQTLPMSLLAPALFGSLSYNSSPYGYAITPYGYISVPTAPVASSYPYGYQPYGYATSPYGYGTAPYGYGTPPYGYNAAPYGYGPPPDAYGQAPYGYGAPQYAYGTPPYGYGTPPYGYGSTPDAYGQAPYGSGQAPYGYGQQAPYGYGAPPYGYGSTTPYGYGTTPYGYGGSPYAYGNAGCGAYQPYATGYGYGGYPYPVQNTSQSLLAPALVTLLGVLSGENVGTALLTGLATTALSSSSCGYANAGYYPPSGYYPNSGYYSTPAYYPNYQQYGYSDPNYQYGYGNPNYQQYGYGYTQPVYAQGTTQPIVYNSYNTYNIRKVYKIYKNRKVPNPATIVKSGVFPNVRPNAVAGNLGLHGGRAILRANAFRNAQARTIISQRRALRGAMTIARTNRLPKTLLRTIGAQRLVRATPKHLAIHRSVLPTMATVGHHIVPQVTMKPTIAVTPRVAAEHRFLATAPKVRVERAAMQQPAVSETRTAESAAWKRFDQMRGTTTAVAQRAASSLDRATAAEAAPRQSAARTASDPWQRFAQIRPAPAAAEKPKAAPAERATNEQVARPTEQRYSESARPAPERPAYTQRPESQPAADVRPVERTYSAPAQRPSYATEPVQRPNAAMQREYAAPVQRSYAERPVQQRVAPAAVQHPAAAHAAGGGGGGGHTRESGHKVHDPH